MGWSWVGGIGSKFNSLSVFACIEKCLCFCLTSLTKSNMF